LNRDFAVSGGVVELAASPSTTSIRRLVAPPHILTPAAWLVWCPVLLAVVVCCVMESQLRQRSLRVLSVGLVR